MQLASVSEILQQKELELIRNPADPLTFVRLFSNNGVKTGDRWKASSEAVADFLAVDHVYENEIELQLKSVNKNFAKVYVVGKAKAEIDDVTTEIEVSGVSLIDLQKNLLTAMRVTIREDRSPGQIAPGFKGQTKINVKMTATETVPELSDEALAVTKSKQIQRMLKWSSDQADFRITYHPRWRVIASESEAVVLRYLDDGDVLAQCNIVQLPARPADNPLKLEDFKAEVEKIVAGEDSASVLSSQEFKTNAGLTALRVQVEGLESTVPIIWTYYHVAGKDGRCLTYVFTLEQRVADRFANADQLLVDETVFKHVIETAKSDKSRSASQTDSKPRR